MTVPTTVQFSFQRYGFREAFADVHYGDFVMKGFRVMRRAQGDGLWIGMPCKQRKGREAEQVEWVDTVWMPDPERKKALERFVLDLYEKELRERDAASAA